MAMIHPTRIISFPRSGHHLLTRGLQWLLQNEMVYSEFYSSPHNMENCPFVNVQKSHDFDLNEPVYDNCRYIIQIRSFELAVESWWKIAATDQTLEEFRTEKQAYFDGFLEKWVASPLEQSIIIDYTDLSSDKTNELIRAYNHICDTPMNEYQQNLLKKWERAEMLK